MRSHFSSIEPLPTTMQARRTHRADALIMKAFN
jgi:hypothetical protein